jgi:hypothetical protein
VPARSEHRIGVEDREPAIGKHEHVVGIGIGVDDAGAAGAKHEHEQPRGGLVRVGRPRQRHAVDPFADQYALVRESRHRCRHAQERMVSQRAMVGIQVESMVAAIRASRIRPLGADRASRRPTWRSASMRWKASSVIAIIFDR